METYTDVHACIVLVRIHSVVILAGLQPYTNYCANIQAILSNPRYPSYGSVTGAASAAMCFTTTQSGDFKTLNLAKLKLSYFTMYGYHIILCTSKVKNIEKCIRISKAFLIDYLFYSTMQHLLLQPVWCQSLSHQIQFRWVGQLQFQQTASLFPTHYKSLTPAARFQSTRIRTPQLRAWPGWFHALVIASR